ncbi:BQ2448_1018 [Microbotryum intermedium]|uniref:BQ2448_1018 protein n=1 Tax=Microbotryum intermedium TaxID=269621 RepID=A0A238F6X1_9BASI|nr:BQ2448_1018 [Microbotryum intermedium]
MGSTSTTTPPTLSAGSSIPFPSLAQYINHPIRVLLAPIPAASASASAGAGVGGLAARAAKGTLYTVDQATQCLVLTIPSTSSTSTPSRTVKRNYSFHHFTSIQSTTLLSTIPDPSVLSLGGNNTSKSGPLSLDLVLDSEEMKLTIERAVAGLVKERSRKPPQGINITQETQALFDGLAKTMPVRWYGAQIIVMDQVIISPPYTVDQVKGEKGAHEGVERVKKVLQGERQRRSSKPTTS